MRVYAACQQEAAAERAGRREAWAQRMADMMSSTPGRVFKWCKDEVEGSFSCLARQDGTLTGNGAEMDSLLRQA